jgi:hypothetical protein
MPRPPPDRTRASRGKLPDDGIVTDRLTDRLAGRLGAVRRRLERLVFLVVWVLVMTLIAFGAAGLASGLDHQPGTDARPELTYAGDAAITPVLDGARTQLRTIADQLNQLGAEGRAAVAHMAATQSNDLEQSLTDGALLIGQIDASTKTVVERLANAPGLGPNSALRLSAANVAMARKLQDAAAIPGDLGPQWAGVTQSSLDATKLTGLLDQHDKLIVAAINASISRKFRTAIARVDQAADALDEAGKVRDRLKARADVSELDEWLRRDRDYDTALRRLYIISAKSPTRITQELRDALAGERKARAVLPRDNSGLVIIMSEIGQGGLNQAVIAIERAREKLSAALADIDSPAASAQASAQP